MLLFALSAGAQEDDEVRPSPPSIGADVPVTYFGPPPSSVEPELIGPLQLLRSGTLNEDDGTITLPLYKGQLAESGTPTWFILTDTTDVENATALGLNVSAKLEFADVCRGVRNAVTEQDASLTFDRGEVDFSPVRSLTPGEAPNYFPPTSFTPGAVGDEFYTPLVRIQNAGNHVYNAPVVSHGTTPEDLAPYCTQDVDEAGRTMIHDSVVRICPPGATDGSGDAYPNAGTVTISLVPGFSFAKPVLYLSTDANNMLAATLEGAIYAPALNDVAVGRDDSAFSAVERIFAFSNGPVNLPESMTGGVSETNPQRQGFNSAVAGQGGPLNVLGGIPTVATDYSPLWDLNLGEWTQSAIDNGYRSRLTEEFQILGMVARGFITGPEGAPYGSTGIIINCPIVHRFL